MSLLLAVWFVAVFLPFWDLYFYTLPMVFDRAVLILMKYYFLITFLWIVFTIDSELLSNIRLSRSEDFLLYFFFWKCYIQFVFSTYNCDRLGVNFCLIVVYGNNFCVTVYVVYIQISFLSFFFPYGWMKNSSSIILLKKLTYLYGTGFAPLSHLVWYMLLGLFLASLSGVIGLSLFPSTVADCLMTVAKKQDIVSVGRLVHHTWFFNHFSYLMNCSFIFPYKCHANLVSTYKNYCWHLKRNCVNLVYEFLVNWHLYNMSPKTIMECLPLHVFTSSVIPVISVAWFPADNSGAGFVRGTHASCLTSLRTALGLMSDVPCFLLEMLIL